MSTMWTHTSIIKPAGTGTRHDSQLTTALTNTLRTACTTGPVYGAEPNPCCDPVCWKVLARDLVLRTQ